MPLSSNTGTRPATTSDDGRQRFHCGDRTVHLTSAVIRDDYAIHPVIDRGVGVRRMQDPLEDDGKRRSVAEERQIVPC
jgi:hypothetical protein